ncbi:MAG TPA: DALR anticodon-binding domain-containing protein, partial [Blastocatellia bacterium]|nr:DALR anticodon-binding domain-containing protein [Blastocatellia bacterium]
TGVQVADVVVGFKYIEGKSLDEIKAIPGKFDYYCWDLYTRAGAFYEDDKTRLEYRAETLHELEAGSGDTYEMADYISTRVLNCHLDTMLRFGVQYDVLPRESDVLHMHLWKHAFQLLKDRGAIEHVTEGKLAGCWVMRALEHQDAKASQIEAAKNKEDTQRDDYEADKVIVRSNGTVTYTGKDIAFHLWKLGQLELDFYYKQFRTYPDGHVVWVTSSDEKENVSHHPKFGSGAAYFNVIDIGQAYPQHYVKLGVMAVNHDGRVERSAHLGYERVVLSPAAVEQLGQRVSEEDRGKSAIGMSGRKGLGVKIDDLIDQLEESALKEVKNRHPDLDARGQVDTAHKIAVGALRYFLLKYTRNSVISFDFKEALAFEGETGPYIQYSVVRANSIFRKLAEAGLTAGTSELAGLHGGKINELLRGPKGDEIWSLVYSASRLNEVLRTALEALEPAVIAKWAFQIAQSFSGFYHNHKILSETDPDRRALLVAVTTIVRQRLIEALTLLGIDAPDRM